MAGILLVNTLLHRPHCGPTAVQPQASVATRTGGCNSSYSMSTQTRRTGPLDPKSRTAAPDTPQMAVLAALAHETGHVYWYDAFVKNRGGHADLNRFCSGNFYTPGSWSHNIDAPPGRWIEFGDRSDNQSYNPDYVSMLASALRMSNFPQAATILYQIYQNQDLADALAAFSPDEDFVEAYQWAVLLKANPPLSSLAIQIPGSPAYDIAAGNLANQGTPKKDELLLSRRASIAYRRSCRPEAAECQRPPRSVRRRDAALWYPVSWKRYETVSGVDAGRQMRTDHRGHLQCIEAFLIDLAAMQPFGETHRAASAADRGRWRGARSPPSCAPCRTASCRFR